MMNNVWMWGLVSILLVGSGFIGYVMGLSKSDEWWRRYIARHYDSWHKSVPYEVVKNKKVNEENLKKENKQDNGCDCELNCESADDCGTEA